MRLEMPEEFVLFDLEFTSWPGAHERGWSGPNEYREIIQIGAIRVLGDKEVDSFCVFVRPEKNPQLSEFIIELTGITQSDVDEKGLGFPEALVQFREFVGSLPAYCFGHDTEVIEENAGFHGDSLSLSREQFHNLRPIVAPVFLEKGVDIDKYSSGTLVEAFTGAPGFRAHDAVNDMRNLLKAITLLEHV